jgi:hypothetical protein
VTGLRMLFNTKENYPGAVILFKMRKELFKVERLEYAAFVFMNKSFR